MLLALFIALQAPAAAPDALAAERATVEKIFAAELGEGRAHATLSGLIGAAPKRLSGSPGAARAVEWCRAEFERSKLDEVRLEKVMVPHWTRGANDSLVQVAADGTSRPLAMLALGGSIGTPKDGLTAEVIVVKSRDELATLGDRAKGKFLFFDQPMDPREKSTFSAYGGAVWQRGHGAVEAAKVGAIGAIVRSMTLRLDDLPHTGSMRYDEGVAKVPAVAISTLAAEALAKDLGEGKSVRLKLKLDCATQDDVESANVIAEIRGREKPDEIVLIGAHLDAWDAGEGAHDDGAGCAHVIEAMRVLRSLDLKPRRTIRAVLFMNEENGLAGGREYARAHAAELEHHVFALETDRGGFAPRGIGAGPELKPALAPLVALLEPWGAGTWYEGDGGADISTLQPAGVPLGEMLPEDARYFDYHHCARDVLGEVDERELALGAATVAATAFLVADHAGAWPRATVEKH
ncbi:MAG: M20/M25/M40 family metallo-hydrolase [Planctomycetes bacterium]|nr:M20/M25/M40 family metallo-hydrolase [Planctomycetota bacterium]